jgi:hypothetical protein
VREHAVEVENAFLGDVGAKKNAFLTWTHVSSTSIYTSMRRLILFLHLMLGVLFLFYSRSMKEFFFRSVDVQALGLT